MKTLLLTLLLVPMMSIGQNNYSMSFDGSNDDILVEGNNLNPNSITIMTSIKILASSAYEWQGIIDKRPGFGLGGYGLEINSLGEYYNFALGTGNSYVSVSSGAVVGVWQNVTATYDGSLLTLYIDGQQVASTVYQNGIISNNDPLSIGSRLNDNFFNGELDNIMIWDYALSAQEIQQYMDCPPNGNETGLVGYWDFEEGSGTTALDLTSNGNDGTINGAIYGTDVPMQNCCTPNPIATQPTNQSVNIAADANISFTDNLTGASYQWQMDSGAGFTNLINAGQFSGSDSQSLTVSSTTMNNNNTLYRCILTESSDCQDTTDVATLTVVNNVGIVELNKTPKKLIKIVDVLGRKTPFKPNTPLLYIYDDGTVERKMIIE